MSTSFVVGIGGQLENGKDKLADYLAKALPGGPWGRDAFAAEVKKVFETTFGVTREWVEHWKRIDTPPPGFLKTVRQMLIDIGDGFRSFRAEVWIDKALRRSDRFILSDARYLNELAAIKDRGGVTVAIYRPDRDNSNPNASERQLRAYVQKFLDAGTRGVTGDPLVDIFVVNDGPLEAMYRYADEVVVPYVARALGVPDFTPGTPYTPPRTAPARPAWPGKCAPAAA